MTGRLSRWGWPVPAALSPSTVPDRRIVSALFATEDGRYLLQLRDDFAGLPLRGHWALFGGAVEPGESAEAALLREIEEELSFSIPGYELFSDALYALPRTTGRVIQKSVFFVPITEADVTGMTLREGADKALFMVDEMLGLARIAPWDLAMVLAHARHSLVFS